MVGGSAAGDGLRVTVEADRDDGRWLGDAPCGGWHEALLYADDAEYVALVGAFIDEGVDAGEEVLVAVPGGRLELLRSRRRVTSPLVHYQAMDVIGRNPAWIIPFWVDFVGPHVEAGHPVRGVGEPIWAGRTADELVECARHEALINVAFAGITGFSLLCPYDVSSLAPSVLAGAEHTHPHLCRSGHTTVSDQFDGEVAPLLDEPVPPAPAGVDIRSFTALDLASIRQRARDLATTAGMPESRVEAFTLAVAEVTTNSVRHAGGTGAVAMWVADEVAVCEVHDAGRIDEPLVGRYRPGIDQMGGRGLWIVHQMCDLVQMRSVPDGQTIRMHMALGHPSR